MNSPTKRIFHNKFFAPLSSSLRIPNSSLAIIMPGVTSSHPVFRSTIPDEIFSVSNGPEATHHDEASQIISRFRCYYYKINIKRPIFNNNFS
ncbi:hypothetical protein CEXT_668021 [Caerostris extrusa]|uniref:Uncharacterized protein n=1 Tax=Caerostris extrusa TaxID=172846 RepID=A0AAV4WZE8_CAEEX|nr:hypothetical protein CEXT_668021 [Caerostris extrusa]